MNRQESDDDDDDDRGGPRNVGLIQITDAGVNPRRLHRIQSPPQKLSIIYRVTSICCFDFQYLHPGTRNSTGINST
jgi:hypothetical protein